MKIIIVVLSILLISINGCKKTTEVPKGIDGRLMSLSTDSSTEYYSEKDAYWKDSSISKAAVFSTSEGNDYETVFHNHTYLRSDIWHYDIGTLGVFVVSQNIKWSIGNHEGNMPYLDATGYLITKKSRSGALWLIQMEADEGKITQDFYHTILFGCCGAISNHTLFNLFTGTKVIEYTEELLSASIPNTRPELERFIGFKSNGSSAPESFERYDNDSLYLGTISYASRDSLLSKIVLRKKANQKNVFGIGPSNFSIIPLNQKDKLFDRNKLVLWSANYHSDPKLFTNFCIKVTYEEITDSVIIPIVGDRIALNTLETNVFTIKILK